ncbi:putative Ig domain-containing protein [Dactylosporangium sp. AC04546]|uniref:putative Ig domain-containing protein n=1 Tax=Dactylosporangium sp. AC04546 TaxID=2862460 RepID=UPI001EDFD4F8|nr:putative Ig domain-containing protein [Dactylosporangium sp. AC04546]WVK82426.1 putative Ig domain-containing protein [Dactylosporangium sp. AC04546]
MCRRGDDGFSLVETLTAIAVMGVVMTALTTFFVSATNTLNKERGLQVAVRYAHDGVEMVRALPAGSVIGGRSGEEVARQQALLSTRDTGDRVAMALQRELGDVATTMDMSDAVDKAVSGIDPADDTLSTEAKPETFFDADLFRYWFVGSCSAPVGSAACESPVDPAELKFYRVVVVVVWYDSRACMSGVCTYSTQTLVTAATTDPVFNQMVTVVPPLPDNPGNQFSDVGVPIRPVRLTATSSSPPYSWSVENLPNGLTLGNDGTISGTPKSVGVSVVRVVVTDRSSSNDASFNWTVSALPVTAPPDQTWDAGAAVSYTLPVTGGVAPYTWSATGLPAGLSLDKATGVVTGTTTVSGAAATASVKVTVVDGYQQTSTATFKWNTRVQVTGPAALTPAKGVPYSAKLTAGGGSGGYTFSSTTLPTGLTLAGDGTISGTTTLTTRYLATIDVRDGAGATNAMVLPVNVAVPGAADLRITQPTTDAPDRTSAKGTALSGQKATASGGTPAYRWAAANLPTGISIAASSGALSGTPSAAGTWIVTITVTDAKNATSSFTFQWKVA